MKKLTVILITVLVFANIIQTKAQILNQAQNLLNQATGGSGYTEKEAADGIKEALTNGTSNAVKLVALKDGYFKNPEIKIPFPPDVKVIESKLRAVGLGKKVDEAILSINRAAEDAGKEAKPIFITAVKNLSIKDAINIVKGQNDAATKYLKNSSSTELNTKFKPIIKASLDKVGATKYWTEIITAYNKIPTVKKLNPDLAQYVTGKAIDGLFVMVAKEEAKIRKDPAAQVSDLLKKIFGKH
ncbi:MAG: DUF4197 domain-containing protein [Bacteroidia bacterium]|nr:DUF4197 domain-containing protein [Bacteroidia bacterium]